MRVKHKLNFNTTLVTKFSSDILVRKNISAIIQRQDNVK